jgi:diaminohydroxyphosphoribosylaminopyrimidine deaminase/5-amino-6-(5-phosphoribosylamino)uracil reductase
MSEEQDQHLIRQAIGLAMRGRGGVEPNPLVGCVIVKNGRVIGQGNHAHFGGPHAEPTALESCREPVAGATAYVTLEPCCHTNKKTPPCVPLLIREKIARVVVGCTDPNPAVNGNGVRMLRDAGIRVDTPVLGSECSQLIAAFQAKTVRDRPYVTLKWAESSDGMIAGPNGERRQISNRESSAVVQQLRYRSDGLMIGVKTILLDDPVLLPRVDEPRPPGKTYIRAVLDAHCNTPVTAKVVQIKGVDRPVRIYCNDAAFAEHADRVAALRALRVSVRALPERAPGRLDLQTAVWHLGSLGVNHLLIEPGSTVAAGCFEQNVVDRLWVIRSPRPIGDGVKATPVPGNFVAVGSMQLGDDVLTEYLNPTSDVYFASTTSADFELSRA